MFNVFIWMIWKYNLQDNAIYNAKNHNESLSNHGIQYHNWYYYSTF